MTTCIFDSGPREKHEHLILTNNKRRLFFQNNYTFVRKTYNFLNEYYFNNINSHNKIELQPL